MGQVIAFPGREAALEEHSRAGTPELALTLAMFGAMSPSARDRVLSRLHRLAGGERRSMWWRAFEMVAGKRADAEQPPP